MKNNFKYYFIQYLNQPKPLRDAAWERFSNLVYGLWVNKNLTEGDVGFLSALNASHRLEISWDRSLGGFFLDRVFFCGEDEEGDKKIKIAVASFLEFLEERRTEGRIAAKPCLECGDYFIQKQAGRKKTYCSSKCMFRDRRKKANAFPESRQTKIKPTEIPH